MLVAYMEFTDVLGLQTKFVTGCDSHTARPIRRLSQLLFYLIELGVRP
jgi:hypothetical protein